VATDKESIMHAQCFDIVELSQMSHLLSKVLSCAVADSVPHCPITNNRTMSSVPYLRFRDGGGKRDWP